MSRTDNIKIRQTWVEEEIEKVSKELDETDDNAFLLIASSLILDCSPNEIEAEDIVDGGQDKQIDLINIEDNQDKGFANITVIQSKNTKGFSSNIVIQIRNGLDWIFERPKSEVEGISNSAFKEKIKEIRSLRSDYGAGNLKVSVYHITNGDKSSLSNEYLEEAKILNEKYTNLGFGDFEFNQLGAHELVELINESDRLKRKVNIELPIIYDINRASIMEFKQGDTSSFVCTVAGNELAKAASIEPRDAIFDLNVRPYYGSKGKVNNDIWNTCTGADSSRFWFLNNGITMVCDTFDFTRDPDDPKLKIRNAQIVNGCQTTVTLREAFEKNELSKDVKILLRLYSTDNPTLVEKITLTTNNQNKITDRDLRANDPVQQDIERIMQEKYGYYYERKNKQYRAITSKKNIVPSPKSAQSYLAIVRKKPANARGYLGAIWSDFYSEIFENASVVDLLVSYKIYELCHSESLMSKKIHGISVLEQECRVYGLFHISRVIGYELLSDCWGHSNIDRVEEVLKNIEVSGFPENIYKDALDVIQQLRQEDASDHPEPSLYFKNTTSQRKLNAKLQS